MKRRDFLGFLAGAAVFSGFCWAGLSAVRYFLPPPPRRVLIREADWPSAQKVKVGAEYFLVRLPGGEIRAFSRRCPHLGCVVNYQPRLGIFLCPCHQSRFSLLGAKLAGPAPRGLYPLKWERTEGGIILEIPG
ncbi:ubiquinol-cytochrome c reductase iron-sulfur subunit [Thermosulfurimonas sp.]|uniref:QcrA and Rieske domain-containing protein n=1 Tax=Thermosulfurimonas sp. TaxID=2080236 RepID=UPI0025CD0211|nr:ubiquinol-cytochrome c reductase iron-sulfur subunit [Thermosulfurimonas sp.]